MTIAIDIALLLPASARAIAERLNAPFDSGDDRGFMFDQTHLPHITIGQHFVSRQRLVDVRSCVGGIASSVAPLEIQVSGARGGRTAQVLVVERSPELQQLHEQVMEAAAEWELGQGDATSFQQDGAPARPADVTWVATFRDQSSHARYDPHLTVGIGSHALAVEPFHFTAREIAVCHLGRFCTCRDTLARWTLDGPTGPPLPPTP